MKFRNITAVVLISASTAFGSFFAYDHYFSSRSNEVYIASSDHMPVQYTSYTKKDGTTQQAVDFSQAADIVIPTTVHIKTKTPPQEVRRNTSPFGDPFFDFFGGGEHYYRPGQLASGSGVIISADGYIVSNNHVVDGASEIAVTLSNDRTYKAKVVGTDPNTDLAVLKIDEQNLPYIVFGNSNDLQVGQWVLACGYPLNLQTTVTAGIISAKSRDIGINDEGTNPIETFIQTDAAVNPGNSGGPLVNAAGELIGINSAIASPTGSFAGYAYAIPSNLVKKVVTDIMKYGTVQRAYLGIQLKSIDHNPASAFKISFNNKTVNGVYVDDVTPKGGAIAAGLRKGDVITGINDQQINSEPELLGVIASYHPGDVVKVTYVRDGREHVANVTLKNRNGTTAIVKATVLDVLGAQFATLPSEDAQKLGISGGVMVGKIGSSGLIAQQTDMKPGFVILKAGNFLVTSTDDLRNALEKQGNNVILQGFYIDRYGNVSGMYSYALNNVKESIVN